MEVPMDPHVTSMVRFYPRPVKAPLAAMHSWSVDDATSARPPPGMCHGTCERHNFQLVPTKTRVTSLKKCEKRCENKDVKKDVKDVIQRCESFLNLRLATSLTPQLTLWSPKVATDLDRHLNDIVRQVPGHTTEANCHSECSEPTKKWQEMGPKESRSTNDRLQHHDHFDGSVGLHKSWTLQKHWL